MKTMIDKVMCLIITCCLTYTIYFEDSGKGFFNFVNDKLEFAMMVKKTRINNDKASKAVMYILIPI